MLLREAQKNSAAAAAVAAAGGVPGSSNISQMKKKSPSSHSLYNYKENGKCRNTDLWPPNENSEL